MAVPTVNGTVGTAKSPGFGNASVTLTKPSGAAVNEVLFAFIDAASGTACSPPAGWSTAYGLQNGLVFAGCYYRVVDGSEGASFTFAVTSGSDRSTGAIFRVGGADTATPLNTSGTSTQTGDTAADTSPSVTTTAADCLIVLAHHNSHTVTTDTVPSGTSEIWLIDYTPDASQAEMKGATASATAAGATGTYLWTINGFAGDAVLSTVAVAPSGGAAADALMAQICF